jgi:c-di-GMP-binding flagellar brake protein YcgR
MIIMDGDLLFRKIFAPGKRILIEYVDPEGMIRHSRTRVEDIEGQYLVLQAPVEKSIELVFRESQELTLRSLVARDNEAYLTNVFVIDIRPGEPPLLICSKPQKIDKTSLRRFSRFDVDLPLEYTIREKTGSGRLNDLSLSGCYARVEADPLISEGSRLDLNVAIQDEEVLSVGGKVIRVDSLPENGWIGLAIDYEEVSDADREILFNYIFQLQLMGDRPRFTGDEGKNM